MIICQTKKYTTNKRIPVPNDRASITTGEGSGSTMLEDSYLTEKVAHFGRERNLERVVHVKRARAYGYFEVTNDLSKYTRAKFLSEVDKKPMYLLGFPQ